MSGLLGAIAEPGSVLDPQRLWRAALRRPMPRARMLLADRCMGTAEFASEGEEVPADCVLLLPGDDCAQKRGSIWVGLHGSLYNLAELARRNEVPYYGDCSSLQAEVVRRCYQRLGPACFAAFRGSFVCAILDLSNNKLLLARDHVGSKSLYFSTRSGFYFASTIEALLEIGGWPPRANRQMLRDWLLDVPTGDPVQTFFDGIVRLPPATWLELDLSRPMNPSLTEFWPIHNLVDREMTREDAAQRLRTLIAESIELSTRNATAAGVTLSGGLDSSVILAALRNCKGQGYPIHSFTFVSATRESQAEESRARAVAGLCGSESHLVRYDCQRIPSEIDALLMNLEEPVVSPVLFAHRELYRAAHAAGIQIVLNGHGPDSLFAGSDSHLVAIAASLCRQGRAIQACTMLANAASGYRRVQLFKSLLGAALPPGIKAALRPAKKPDWLNDDWFQERKTATRNGDGERATHLRIQLVRELRELSLPHILHFEERATEAHLVRGCSPFLAPEVVEFALSLPPELLTGGNGYKKSILRAAGRDLLPDAILESRERMGFPVPADEWLRSLTGWASEELPSIQALPFIHGPRVQQLWESFRRSNGSNWQRAIEIWRLIFVARWARVCRAEF